MESLFSTKHELRVFDHVVPMDLVGKAWTYAHERAVWEFANGGDASDPLTSWVADIMNYFQNQGADGRAAKWNELTTTMPFVVAIWKLVSEAVPGVHVIERACLNGHTFGLGDGTHRDGDTDAFTFLVYMNPEWKLEWGGETLFYSEAIDDVVAAIVPKPGRLVYFDGRIQHAGRAPSRLCVDLRVTLAFQTVRTSLA
jgi:hypothetical protein